jgi:DNA-binding transcriptional MerR regulator
MKRLKIDDVAKETGLTKRTIRYYEQIGLIEPPERSEKGTRLYTEKDVDRLKKVITAREVLGFSLQELQQFLTLHETIEAHRRDYRNSTDKEKKQQELKEIAAGINKQVEMLQRKITKMTEFKIELEQLQQTIQSILEEEK